MVRSARAVVVGVDGSKVAIHPAIWARSVHRYLAADDEPDQLFVTDSQASWDVCGPHNVGRSVHAVRSKNP